MEFKKAMTIMRKMCNNVEVNCDKCPLLLNDNCSVRPWADSDVEQVEGILEKWAKEHPEPQYPTWGEFLQMTYHNRNYAAIFITPIPADIAEKLGLKPKEAANNAGH